MTKRISALFDTSSDQNLLYGSYSVLYEICFVWHALCINLCVGHALMFKISTIETQAQRKLVLAGKLVPPWTAEVENAWKAAADQLRGKRLVVDLTNVTVISQDGENLLFRLMKDGAKFAGKGVLTRHILKQLARRCRCKPEVDVDFEQAQTTNH